MGLASISLPYNKLAYEFRTARKQRPDPLPEHGWEPGGGRALGLGVRMLQKPDMTLTKPTFPAPDHDHGRCTAEAMAHAEAVCARRTQKFTPIRRQVLQALLSSH